ncbi:MAG: hypothetical protein ACUZ8O_17590 [Candidatus Anammoxibacter sp.]
MADICRKEGRIIVTLDTDFSDICRHIHLLNTLESW